MPNYASTYSNFEPNARACAEKTGSMIAVLNIIGYMSFAQEVIMEEFHINTGYPVNLIYKQIEDEINKIIKVLNSLNNIEVKEENIDETIDTNEEEM